MGSSLRARRRDLRFPNQNLDRWWWPCLNRGGRSRGAFFMPFAEIVLKRESKLAYKLRMTIVRIFCYPIH